MVWLPVAEENGNALYLDIHHVELRPCAKGEVFAVAGTLGDGLFEGLVLLEVSEGKTEITFADEWLCEGALRDFFQRVDRDIVESGLTETVAEMVFCIADFPSLAGKPRQQVVGFSRGGRSIALPGHKESHQLALPMTVCEPTVGWQAAG